MSPGTVHRLERAESTQDVLHELASAGAPAGTAVVAAEQRAGRGSRGRPWHSPRGGLWLSVLLRPTGPVGLEVLSLRVGLATAETLAAELGACAPPIGIKWPNDLVAADRKLGGILCEARWQGDTLAWVAVGLGINVTNPLPADGVAATRLANFCPDAEPAALAEPVARAVVGVADSAAAGSTATDRLDTAELAAFRARDWLRGRELLAPARGRALGIAADGTLIVRTPDGDRGVRSGSVVLAGAPDVDDRILLP